MLEASTFALLVSETNQPTEWQTKGAASAASLVHPGRWCESSHSINTSLRIGLLIEYTIAYVTGDLRNLICYLPDSTTYSIDLCVFFFLGAPQIEAPPS